MTYLCNKNGELKNSWNSAAAGRDYTVRTPPGKFALSHLFRVQCTLFSRKARLCVFGYNELFFTFLESTEAPPIAAPLRLLLGTPCIKNSLPFVVL